MKTFLFKINKTLQTNFASILILFTYPLALFFTLSILDTGSVFTLGIISGLKVVFLFYILFVIFAIIFLNIFSNIFISYLIITLPIALFCIVNYFKLLYTGEVLLPNDFNIQLLGHAMQFLKPSFDFYIFIVIVLLVLEMMIVFLCRNVFVKFYKNIRFKIISIILLILFSMTQNNLLYKYCVIESSENSPVSIYERNGSAIGFLMLINQVPSIDVVPDEIEEEYILDFKNKQKLLENYNEQTMKNVLTQVRASTAIKNNIERDSIKPNVIIIMSEAFWNPTRVSGLNFSQDPIENYRELSSKYTSGSIISPVIGGGTSNVEFELLFGTPISFLNKNEYPFMKYPVYVPKEDKRTLPYQFKQNGYKTVLVNPYDKTFYNRDKIYPLIGMDNFISKSEFEKPLMKGGFVSDDIFADEIISTINTTKDEPLFLFGISTQNHYPYLPSDYSNYDLDVKSTKLDTFQNQQFKSYAQGVFDADKSLAKIVSFLENQEKPTLLFFFGDHLPLISNNPMDVYKKLGYISAIKMDEWSLQDSVNMYSTPYILWSNYSTKKEDIGNISPYFIGPILMKKAGLQANLYTDYLMESYSYFHAMNNKIFIDKNNKPSKTINKNSKNIVENLFNIYLDHFPNKQNTGKQYINNEMIAKIN